MLFTTNVLSTPFTTHTANTSVFGVVVSVRLRRSKHRVIPPPPCWLQHDGGPIGSWKKNGTRSHPIGGPDSLDPPARAPALPSRRPKPTDAAVSEPRSADGHNFHDQTSFWSWIRPFLLVLEPFVWCEDDTKDPVGWWCTPVRAQERLERREPARDGTRSSRSPPDPAVEPDGCCRCWDLPRGLPEGARCVRAGSGRSDGLGSETRTPHCGNASDNRSEDAGSRDREGAAGGKARWPRAPLTVSEQQVVEQ